MTTKSFRWYISLEAMSIIACVIGFLLIVTSCRIGKDTYSKESTTHTEKEIKTTTYKDTIVDVVVKGDSAKEIGTDIVIFPKDTVPIAIVIPGTTKIDTVYVPLPKDIKHYSVNILPVIAIGEYGYAKAWVTDNKLYVEYHVLDYTIQTKIDSAIQIINIDKIVNDTKEITKEELQSKWGLWMLLMLLIVAIGSALVTRLSYGGSHG